VVLALEFGKLVEVIKKGFIEHKMDTNIQIKIIIILVLMKSVKQEFKLVD